MPASATHRAVLFGEPLPGARRQVGGAAAGGPRAAGDTCESGCGFFAWLETLIGGESNPQAPRPEPEVSATAASTVPAAGQNGNAALAAPAPATDASLRVPEVVGRIWIAPFVDADGIYREAHWVRVVLEPAGWKLP